jgi:Domain of unknown function (DUF4105)
VRLLKLAKQFLGWLIAAIWFLCRVVLIAWAGLAIYYSNLPWAGLRLALAIAFAAFAIWAIWLSGHRRRRMFVALIVLYLGVVAWWISISPSHDRHWRPEVAMMPRAFIDGDRVRITGVRNFQYHTRDDFTVRYEEREISLAHLTGLDFYISYWSEGPVGHTFLSFIFDNAPPLSISIETRPEVGEGFAPIASLFKQFELIYVVGGDAALRDFDPPDDRCGSLATTVLLMSCNSDWVASCLSEDLISDSFNAFRPMLHIEFDRTDLADGRAPG